MKPTRYTGSIIARVRRRQEAAAQIRRQLAVFDLDYMAGVEEQWRRMREEFSRAWDPLPPPGLFSRLISRLTNYWSK